MADTKSRYVNGSGKEYVTVCLSEIRKEMQCPICLGIIRKTRTVMECLHRFCRECIDKSMRLGNNECPACRTHCASRRSLRDDPNFDSLIAALYPDIDQYEEEELMLLEDENRKNKQIQASIAETFKRQSEAAARRRTTAKVTAAAIVRKAHGKFRHVKNRNRAPPTARGSRANGPVNYGSSSPQDDDQGFLRSDPSSSQPPNNISEDAEEPSEPPTEVKKEVSKDRAGWRKRRRPRHVEPANSEEEPNGAMLRIEENPPDELKLETQMQQESSPADRPGLITWARAGARSQTRYSLGAINLGPRNANRCIRASALLDFLTSTSRKDNEEEYDIHLHLQPLEASDEMDVLPNLERPYLCCPPQMTVQYLCKHLVTRLPQARGGELELFVERMSNSNSDHVRPGKGPSMRLNKLARVNKQLKDRILEPLELKDTLQYVLSSYWDKDGNLELLYRLKNEW